MFLKCWTLSGSEVLSGIIITSFQIKTRQDMHVGNSFFCGKAGGQPGFEIKICDRYVVPNSHQ